MTEKVNLFVYGSLRDSRIFQSVSGYAFTLRPSRIDEKTLFGELAFLPHYRRVSPDNVYYYAVPAPPARIEGIVVHYVPAAAMLEINRYEGKRYQRGIPGTPYLTPPPPALRYSGGFAPGAKSRSRGCPLGGGRGKLQEFFAFYETYTGPQAS